MHVTVLRIPDAVNQEGFPPIERAGAGEFGPRRVCTVNPTLRAREVCVEIVVTGRNVEVPDHFRVHVAEKVARLERYDHRMVGMEVELFHERNRRQLKSCQRVEITGRGCEGVARAEACAQDFYGALDAAIAKLESQLRRSHDRRRVTGKRTRVMAGRGSSTAVLDEVRPLTAEPDGEQADFDGIPAPRSHYDHLDDNAEPDPDPVPGRVVRRKAHTDAPMSVEDALARMELVGHDFYLFSDADSGKPCVVYRRRGYDYGVISLTH
jgi:ribosomal subunit interface protein